MKKKFVSMILLANLGVFSMFSTTTFAKSVTNVPFEVLKDKTCGTYNSDYYLASSVDTVTWGRLPNKNSKPAITIESGSTITIDTLSHEGLLEDQGKDPIKYFESKGVSEDEILPDAVEIAKSDLPHNFDADGPHVITGPVYVNGAKKGDVLKVEVLSLEPRVPYGVISNRHFKGALPGEFPENEGRLEGASAEHPERYNNVSIFTPIEQINGKWYASMDDADSGKEIKFPIRPFLGTMGVANDSDEKWSTIPPTKLGGNLDINELGVGSTLYLPIDVDGALFYTGDPHFAQGDGEVALTALEGSLRGTLRLTVLKKGSSEIPGNSNNFDMPFGETQDYWIPIGLNTDLDEAMKQSVRESIDFISEQLKIDRKLAYAYLSAATDYEVSQVVDKTKGIHALISKTDFAPYITTELSIGAKSTVPTEIINDTLYVDANKVITELGGKTKYEGNTLTATINGKAYCFTVNSNVYSTSSQKVTLSNSPVFSTNTVMIPVATIKEVLGYPVNWSVSGTKVIGKIS